MNQAQYPIDENELKQRLGAERYHVLREKGTEAPYSGALLENHETGMYTCGVCGAEIFGSDAKYESALPGLMGWPSFSDVAKSDAVELVDDNSFGMRRTEVNCKQCGSHLGHLFPDDTSSTGQHYCINSASLDFKKAN